MKNQTTNITTKTNIKSYFLVSTVFMAEKSVGNHVTSYLRQINFYFKSEKIYTIIIILYVVIGNIINILSNQHNICNTLIIVRQFKRCSGTPIGVIHHKLSLILPPPLQYQGILVQPLFSNNNTALERNKNITP